MSRDVWAGIAATLAVVVAAILGFRVLGGPANQRLVQADLRKLNTLSQLAQQINQRWVTDGKTLPVNLEKLPSSVKQDPVSGAPFVYHAKSSEDYELCATFASDNRDAPPVNNENSWTHPKGEHCFQFQASGQVPWVPYGY
jgi:hypothetical protein